MLDEPLLSARIQIDAGPLDMKVGSQGAEDLDQTSRSGKPISIVLASASPRRRQLLTEAGYQLTIDPAEIDEPEPPPGADVFAYVAELAWRKARTVALRRGAGLILGADTACTVGGAILNKPIDRADAERMIRLQEGADTLVLTGLCLYRTELDLWLGAVETSVVRFKTLTQAEREAFLDTHRWHGKAGAYGVQDQDPWVSVVAGSFSNVVGLPMERLEALLRDNRELLLESQPAIPAGRS